MCSVVSCTGSIPERFFENMNAKNHWQIRGHCSCESPGGIPASTPCLEAKLDEGNEQRSAMETDETRHADIGSVFCLCFMMMARLP